MCELLTDFLREDCDATVRQMLLDEIERHRATPTESVREFTFNRFNVILDFVTGKATIEDELDASERGSCWMFLADFSEALEQCAIVPPVCTVHAL